MFTINILLFLTIKIRDWRYIGVEIEFLMKIRDFEVFFGRPGIL